MHLSSAPLRRDVVFLPENIRHEHRLQEHRVENRQRVEAVDGCRYLVHWRRHTRLLRHACSVTAQPRKTAPLLRRKKSADDADHFSVLLISSFCSLALCVCVLSSKLAGVPFVTRDGSAQRALLLLLLFVDKDVEIVENSAGNATRQLNWQALLACLFVCFFFSRRRSAMVDSSCLRQRLLRLFVELECKHRSACAMACSRVAVDRCLPRSQISSAPFSLKSKLSSTATVASLLPKNC